MAWRFRRSIKILPGLRLNIGKKGASISAGPKGFTTTIGKTGVHQNVGLTGTGLSYRTKIGAPRPSGSPFVDNEADPIASDPQFALGNYQPIERSNGSSSMGFYIAVGVIGVVAMLIIFVILASLL